MGRDKAWLEIDGVPLVERVARRLLPLASEIIFSANEPQAFDALLARLPLPASLAVDVYPGAGPLAGLHAGILAARNDRVLAVATDMPFVDHQLVREMTAACRDADAVVPRLMAKGFEEPQPEPLHAVYRKSCLPAIEAALTAGRRRMASFLQDIEVCYLDEDLLRQFDPELKSFRNVNTPEEWARITDAHNDRAGPTASS
jgi:molybdopterin-guanine dinucleotide biosynthesis protein A